MTLSGTLKRGWSSIISQKTTAMPDSIGLDIPPDASPDDISANQGVGPDLHQKQSNDSPSIKHGAGLKRALQWVKLKLIGQAGRRKSRPDDCE